MAELEVELLDGDLDQFFLQFDTTTKVYGNSSCSFEFRILNNKHG